MSDPITRQALKATELESLIMTRLKEHSDCAGITYVYIRPTGRKPPEETWTHTLVSRRPNLLTNAETVKMLAVLNDMRTQFDLLPE